LTPSERQSLDAEFRRDEKRLREMFDKTE
jgi:hypothetical protein